MLKIVFWTAVAIVAYIYFGYPLLLALWSIFKKEKREKKEIVPRITLIVSAYNEEKIIERKIENSLELNYPKDRLEIIVVSDGSTDNTDGIVKGCSSKFDNVKLVRVGGRSGKNIALNKVLPHTSGDITVFSDANSMYEGDAIRNLVNYFGKKEIGCVIGELKYVNTDSSNVSQGQGLYWKYESFIKRLESRLGLLLVGNGSIFAIRKELYPLLEPGVPNDLQTPLEIGHRGYQVIYEPKAVAIEKAAISSREEFRKKVRIINRGLMGFLKLRKKVKGWRLFGFISHKLLRWLAGIFLILIFLSNIFLVGFNLYRILFLLQLLFYGLAGMGTYFQSRRIRCGIFCVPFYFFLINLASFVALFEFLLGKRYFIWEKASRKEQMQNM
jgi:cellulose synthase/poly-beta-1,6-N-acetylglucosamine synthase-like glycosyltransferase